MFKLLDKLSHSLDKFCKVAGVLLLIIVAGASIIQVFGRYVMGYSPVWAEELSRYGFVWMNMLGAAILVKSKQHAVIDVAVAKLAGKAKKIHTMIIVILMLVCALILVVYGNSILGVLFTQESPAMRIPMAIPYLAIPVAGVVMVVHCVSEIFRIVSLKADVTLTQE